ncbi:MAG TPA: YfhO family protein [Thermoanaerobaculia bacterium]|nr:YfhO family protein [Thermoanaerobaculia bacterium]
MLVLLLVIAYANVVFLGRSLVYSDNYNPLDARSLPQNYGAELVPADAWAQRNLLLYANFHDPGGSWWQGEPGGEFLRDALRRGEWPWWDPYVAAGAPAMANLTQSFFFPPYALVVALGNTSLLKNVYILSLLLVAAFSSYLFLRRHGLSAEGSAIAAAAVLYCGGLVQNVGSFIGQTGALLPVTLLLTRWFLDRPSWRRAAVLAVGYATVACASFPPLLVAAFGLTALYAATMIARDVEPGRRAIRYAAAVAVSLALVAPVYAPALWARHELPQVAATYAGAAETTVRVEALSQLLSPVLMGGGKVYVSPPMPEIGDIQVPYVGVVVLLLAGLAGPLRRRDASLLFAVLAAGATLIASKLIGVRPVQWISVLPVLEHIHFAHYFGIPLGILLCLLTGFGVDRLLAGRVSGRRLLAIGGGLGAVTLLLPFVAHLRGALTHPWAGAWLARWYLLVGLLALAVGVVALGRRAGGRATARAAAVGLLALLAVEGTVNSFYPRQRRADVWRHPPPYVEELVARRHEGRIFTAATFPANSSSAFEVFGLDSLMTFNPSRMFELYKRHVAPNAYLFLRDAAGLPPEGVLDAANVGLLALREMRGRMIADAHARGHATFWHDGEVRLLARETEPRYYFTSEYRVLPKAEALAAVAEERPPRQVILEAAPSFAPAANPGGAPRVAARLTRNRVTLRLTAPRAGLVYCSEAFAPGWTATVNGAPAAILPANFAFRAVPVPAGEVVVELRYFPPGLRLGLVLAGVAVGALLLLVLWRERAALRPLSLRAAPAWPLPRRALWAIAGVVLVLGVGFEAGRRLHLAKLVPVAVEDPTRPRPDSFYRVEWEGARLAEGRAGGETVEVLVSLRNAGTETWPNPETADPRTAVPAGAVRLSWRWWWGDREELVSDYSARIDLPAAVGPGESVTLPVEVVLPTQPGDYSLQLDLVHELVAWFEQRGADTLLVPVTVEPAR